MAFSAWLFTVDFRIWVFAVEPMSTLQVQIFLCHLILPIMTTAALGLTYFFRKTGHVYAGAFPISILVVWIVVASQATHVAF